MTTIRRALLPLIIVALHLCGVTYAASLKVVTDRPDAMYKCGETARFLVSASEGPAAVNVGEFDYALSLDGGRLIGAGQGKLGDKPAEITGTLDTPGILRCTVALKTADKPVIQLAGAAFSPENIAPTAVEPADFGAFWDGKKKELAAIPMDVKLTEAPKLSDDKITTYKISLANVGGARVYGWFAVPKGGKGCPAILTVPWAGVYPTPTGWATDWARRGFVAMGISAHDYDVDLPKEKYTEIENGALKGWPYIGRQSRDTCYFLRMFLGCGRAVDYLVSRPEWDGKHIIVNGSSQGGGLSLVTAGLDQRITALAANVPALCDHTGYLQGRPSGWPQLVPGGNTEIAKVSAYFDAVNFARRIKCPTVVGVGLVDQVCPATTVYSAYNVLLGNKEIIPSPLMGHSTSAQYGARSDKFIVEQAFGAAK